MRTYLNLAGNDLDRLFPLLIFLSMILHLIEWFFIGTQLLLVLVALEEETTCVCRDLAFGRSFLGKVNDASTKPKWDDVAGARLLLLFFSWADKIDVGRGEMAGESNSGVVGVLSFGPFGMFK